MSLFFQFWKAGSSNYLADPTRCFIAKIHSNPICTFREVLFYGLCCFFKNLIMQDHVAGKARKDLKTEDRRLDGLVGFWMGNEKQSSTTNFTNGTNFITE
jgi:hypothetical protein